jgi:hypothetical protein
MIRSRRRPSRTVLALPVALALAAAASSLPSAQGQALPITWSAPAAAVRAASGGAASVEVSARIDEGWHLYSLTQPSPPDPTVISVPAGQVFTLGGAVEAPVPEKGFDAAQGADTEYYTEAVTFRLPLTIDKTAKPGALKVIVTAKWQACNGSLCLRPQTTTIEVPVQVEAAK